VALVVRLGILMAGRLINLFEVLYTYKIGRNLKCNFILHIYCDAYSLLRNLLRGLRNMPHYRSCTSCPSVCLLVRPVYIYGLPTRKQKGVEKNDWRGEERSNRCGNFSSGGQRSRSPDVKNLQKVTHKCIRVNVYAGASTQTKT